MAGSQYPQTTRSLLKAGLILFIILRLFLLSGQKSSSPSKMDQSFPSLLASRSLKKGIGILIKFNSGHDQEAKSLYIAV